MVRISLHELILLEEFRDIRGEYVCQLLRCSPGEAHTVKQVALVVHRELLVRA